MIPQLERPGVHVVSARITDTHFYLQATSDRVTAEVRRGDIVQAGVVIANSEVGASSLRISPMVYRLICTNGLISGSELRQHHVGRGIDPADDGASEFYRDETCRAVDRAFWLKVVDIVDAAMNEALFGQLVDKLRVAAGEPLDAKPSEIVEVVARRFGLTEAEQDGVLHQLATRRGLDSLRGRQRRNTYRGRFGDLRSCGRARAHRWRGLGSASFGVQSQLKERRRSRRRG